MTLLDASALAEDWSEAFAASTISIARRQVAQVARRGYSQEDLEKISSRNMMRVMRAAEVYAVSQRNATPIEYAVGAPRDGED